MVQLKLLLLLGICCQRLRQLLKEKRIRGAKKVGRFWQIPLFGGMPKVKAGSRGPQGTWRKRLRQASTCIHINKRKLESNSKYNQREPIIAIRNGDREARPMPQQSSALLPRIGDSREGFLSETLRAYTDDRVKYCHEVEITGACRLVYRPDKPLSCGAVLWIEVEANVEAIAKKFNSFVAVRIEESLVVNTLVLKIENKRFIAYYVLLYFSVKL